MPRWDVCLFSPAKADAGTYKVGDRVVQLQERKSGWGTAYDGVEYFRINGKSSRVASRGQERAGLSDDEIQKVKDDFFAIPGNKGKSIPDRVYRVARSRPLLMLHFLKLSEDGEGTRAEQAVLAWGISFKLTDRPGQRVEYVVNTTWWRSNFQDDLDEADEESELADE